MKPEPEEIDYELLNSAIKLNVKLLGLIFGFVSGLTLFVITIISYSKSGGGHLNLLGIVFFGYSVSIKGAIIGFFWAFFYGGIFGGLLYFTYSKSICVRIREVISDNTEKDVFLKPQILKIESRPLSLAIASGIALLLFLSTNFLVLRGTADESMHAALLSFYLPGYSVSFVGSLIGSIELFAFTYFIFLVFGYTYNNITDYRNRNNDRLFYYKSKKKIPKLTPSKHVCILGAGPAGLATGHELSTNGTKVTILERNDYVSGLCRTVVANGYRFDLGGHRWFTQNEELNNWFRRLMKDEIVMVNRISRIYYGGQYYNYPLSIGDVVTKAGFFTIFFAGITFAKAVVVYNIFDKPVTNMKEAYTKQFGSQLYEMFFKIYTEKVWGKLLRRVIIRLGVSAQ